MHERAPTAFMLSLSMHVGVVLAIATLAFVVQHNRPPPVQIFELVAGPPTDPRPRRRRPWGARMGRWR